MTPYRKQRNDAAAIAANILDGTLFCTCGCCPGAKNMKYASFRQIDRNVPMLAKYSSTSAAGKDPAAAALVIMDLLMNPLKSGTPEMENAPIMKKTVTNGIFLYSPPSSESFLLRWHK